MSTQNLDDLFRATNRKSPAHGKASSSTLAPWASGKSAGSNQSASASLAFAIASSSVSPALAHPGNSGNTADQRFTSRSNSITSRSFTKLKIPNSLVRAHALITSPTSTFDIRLAGPERKRTGSAACLAKACGVRRFRFFLAAIKASDGDPIHLTESLRRRIQPQEFRPTALWVVTAESVLWQTCICKMDE